MKLRVLFVCSENSARSQMAEALLRHMAGNQFESFSAGTRPGEIDARTLESLSESGVNTENLYAKSIDTFKGQSFDFVITLCDKVRSECPDWPGRGVLMTWDFPDPKGSQNPKAFLATLQAIRKRLQLFLEVNRREVDCEVVSLTAPDFFKALADQTRLLSVLLIEREKELCVCELMAALDLSQPRISRHLAYLRKAGLLADRRQGQWVFYRIHPLLPGWMREVIGQTLEQAPEDLELYLSRLGAMAGRPGQRGTLCGEGDAYA